MSWAVLYISMFPGVPGLYGGAIVATTHFSMAQETRVGHMHAAAVFSLSTDGIYLPIRSAWAAGYRGVCSETPWNSRPGRQQAGQPVSNAARTRGPPSLGAMVTGARLSGRCCPSGPEPASCCWKRWGSGAGTVTAWPCPREESPALWRRLPSVSQAARPSQDWPLL